MVCQAKVPLDPPLVIVFGAGSTIAEAAHCGFTGRERPPTDLDFLRRARYCADGEDLGLVEDYIRKRYGTGLRSRGAPRMERVFSGAFSELLLAPKEDSTARALLRIYRDVIAKTTDQFEPRLDGPICRLLEIAAGKPAGTTLITFNHDLVVERALESVAKYHPGLWSIRNGYGDITFEGFTKPTRGATAVFSKSRRGSRLPLLKLHGSFNWHVPMNRKRSPPLWDPKKKPRCTRRRSVPDAFHISRGERLVETWPVIVPPVTSKLPLFEGVLRGLWQQAAAALSEAQSVLLFGYSFPPTDAEAEALFRSACRARHLRSLVVVNPDCAAGARAYEIVGGERLLHYGCCSEMLGDIGA